LTCHFDMIYFVLSMHFYSHSLSFFHFFRLYPVNSFINHFLLWLCCHLIQKNFIYVLIFYLTEWRCLWTCLIVYDHYPYSIWAHIISNHSKILLCKKNHYYYLVISKVTAYKFEGLAHEQFFRCFFFDILVYFVISFHF